MCCLRHQPGNEQLPQSSFPALMTHQLTPSHSSLRTPLPQTPSQNGGCFPPNFKNDSVSGHKAAFTKGLPPPTSHPYKLNRDTKPSSLKFEPKPRTRISFQSVWRHLRSISKSVLWWTNYLLYYSTHAPRKHRCAVCAAADSMDCGTNGKIPSHPRTWPCYLGSFP